MSSDFAGTRVKRQTVGRKEILPAPLPVGVGVFALQGIGEVNLAIARRQVCFMEEFDLA
jgi:hypothetical protein